MTAQELKQKRIDAGMTQQALAEAAGITGINAKQRIYDYEGGRRNLTPAMQRLFSLIFSASKSSG